MEAIKVKHEKEIFLLKTEMKKKDELQRETERTLNEVRWELEEVTEQNKQNEAELKRIKEDSASKDVVKAYATSCRGCPFPTHCMSMNIIFS